MTFNSIEEAITYIEGVVSGAMPVMGNEMRLIMKEAIETEIYNDHENTTGTRTGQLGECADIVETTNSSVTTEYRDSGSWSSAISGEKFFPLEGYLAGSVWGKNGTYYNADPTTEAFFKANEEIPEKLKQYLISMGIDVV